MNTQTTDDFDCRNDKRHLLVAVDESDNARRTVAYVADLFGGISDACVTLLSIIQEPSEDFFPTAAEAAAWLREREATLRAALAAYRELLSQGGFAADRVASRVVVRACPSIAGAILDERAKLGCRIVVVGRRGVSRNEEFIFGSTSSKILHEATDCAVLVVE
ncbi:MAG: universal stress protein [Pseudomonadota bacterium]